MTQQLEGESGEAGGDVLWRGFAIAHVVDCIADPRKTRVIADLSDDISPVFPYLNRLLPNLHVGLNAYLYRPEAGDNLSLSRQFGDRIMGLGPGIKYDLGRWSFLLKTQLETGNRDHGADGMQSSVRVWYAF